jgi:hypothetical protein
MSYIAIIIGVVIGIAAFALLYRPFFGEENDFWECVEYSFKPDFWSWLNNDLQRDYGKSLKLGVFFAIVIGCGIFGAYIAGSVFK